MKVFFLLSDNLAEDIEEARREISAVKEGKAEICVLAREINRASVDRVLEIFCVSVVYVMDERGVMGGFMDDKNECVVHRVYSFDCDVNKSILEPGDWIFARRTTREDRELIATIVKDVGLCDVTITI